MKKLIYLIPLILAGCATFSTRQTDISYDTEGNKIREITTQAKAKTFIESKSALTNFKASQTDKTQSASVGNLSQESTISTNAVDLTESIARGIAAGILKGVKP